MAVPLRHLESAAGPRATLPAGGLGDLEAAVAGQPVVVMATDAGDGEVPAATWRATFVRRVPHEIGTPWPDGVPPTVVRRARGARGPCRCGRPFGRRSRPRRRRGPRGPRGRVGRRLGRRRGRRGPVVPRGHRPRAATARRVALRERAGRQAGARRAVLPAAGTHARHPSCVSLSRRGP